METINDKRRSFAIIAPDHKSSQSCFRLQRYERKMTKRLSRTSLSDCRRTVGAPGVGLTVGVHETLTDPHKR